MEEPTHPPTLLVVDDEEDILLSFRWLMERNFPQTRLLTALNGEQGLLLVRDHRVDLCISDYRMPGMDGIEFLSQAHRLRPAMRGALSTAYPDAGLHERAHSAGIRDVFLKAFELEELLEFICRALGVAVIPTPKRKRP